jgi:hypothetical protein
MADRNIAVVTAATSQDLLTLTEAKTFLNIPVADTSRDAQLQMQISIASAYVGDQANRKPPIVGFGQSEVTETWREIGNGRLFLMHWPLKDPNGIVSITAGGATLAPADYGLDVNSGKVSMYGGNWPEPAIVHYIGGFVLPDKAPLPLKWACAIIVQEQRIRNQQAQVAGIRLLTHKEARVAFFDPNALLLKTVGAKSPGMVAADILIRPYIRIEV